MSRIGPVAALCAALIVPGCGGQDQLEQDEPQDMPPAAAPAADTGTAPAGTAVAVVLTEWEVTLAADSVAAGVITFDVQNNGTQRHALEIEGNGQEWETNQLEPGARVSMSVNLAPGEYKVYCPIEGGGESHEARGMVTRLRIHAAPAGGGS